MEKGKKKKEGRKMCRKKGGSRKRSRIIVKVGCDIRERRDGGEEGCGELNSSGF